MFKFPKIQIIKFLIFFILIIPIKTSFGEDIEESANLEIKQFKTECLKGDAEGCNTAASILFSFERYKEAFELFKIGCEKLNNSVSCYNVGDFFINGYGNLPKDEKKAIYYFKKACELSVKNHEDYCGGCYSLGTIFLIKSNPKKAVKYFSLDCSKNCCEACFEIENMYRQNLISKTSFLSIKSKNKNTFETCDFLKKFSDDNIEE
ncbi:MAG: hypothetical protein DSY66_02775 [Persephonella sp.]|nr:MAG: hypothetical protein DSY53_02395 [Persephonella sp.]RUM61148.1 MAG: hypothetical protein DSY66_02775 [Persephonella sp.]